MISLRNPRIDSEYLGRCCADVYTHPVVTKLLDGIFHPGGLALSNLMAEKMRIDSGSKVLDIACGDGLTATFLAKKFSCHVSGIDAGSSMIDRAITRAQEAGVGYATDFRVGYATNIPFPDAHFDAAYSECAVCTFNDKNHSVQETIRVLRVGGTLGVNDIIIRDFEDLDEELKGILGQVLCIAGALSPDGYITLFEQGGFSLKETSSHTDVLKQMVDKASNRVRMLTALDESFLETASIDDVSRIIRNIKDQIHTGNIGYAMFIFEKSV